MFLQNKYTTWYNNIITKSQIRGFASRKKANEVLGYSEYHHIVPRCLGGGNLKENLVYLTAKEHFICHLLLTKMTQGKIRHKMIYALFRMTTQANKFQPRYSSKNYEVARTLFSSINPFKMEKVRRLVSIRMTKHNPMKDPRIAKKVSMALTGKLIGDKNPFYGERHTSDTKTRMSLAATGKKKSQTAIQKRLDTIKSRNRPRMLLEVTCPYCHLRGKGGNMTRYHFKNCNQSILKDEPHPQ